MRERLPTIVVLLGVLALAPFTDVAQAQAPGVSDKEILLCSYQPMTGKDAGVQFARGPVGSKSGRMQKGLE